MQCHEIPSLFSRGKYGWTNRFMDRDEQDAGRMERMNADSACLWSDFDEDVELSSWFVRKLADLFRYCWIYQLYLMSLCPCLALLALPCLIPGEGWHYLGCSFGGALISFRSSSLQGRGVRSVREPSSGSPSVVHVGSNYSGPDGPWQ